MDGVIDLEGIIPNSSYDDNLSILTKELKPRWLYLNIPRWLLEVIYKSLVYGWENKKLNFNYDALFSKTDDTLIFIYLDIGVILTCFTCAWYRALKSKTSRHIGMWFEAIKGEGRYYSGCTIKVRVGVDNEVPMQDVNITVDSKKKMLTF